MGAELVEKILSFLLSLITVIFPLTGSLNENAEFTTKNGDPALYGCLISDVHVDYRDKINVGEMKAGFKNLREAENEVDVVLVDGDLTIYGDIMSLEAFYDAMAYSPAKSNVIVAGNHDIGHVNSTETGAPVDPRFCDENGNKLDKSEQDKIKAREDLISYYNDFEGTDFDKIYYSYEVNGYTFIVLGDEGNDHWDAITISQEQLQWLDEELAKATADGKPVFVCCHWPVEGTIGEETVWDGNAIEKSEADVHSILKNYENVFFFNGHLHSGINDNIVFGDVFGFRWVETYDGVTYVSLPSYCQLNRYGVMWPGVGVMMEVYEDQICFRPRALVTGMWYSSYEYSVPLVTD